jgi:hypothetical protein
MHVAVHCKRSETTATTTAATAMNNAWRNLAYPGVAPEPLDCATMLLSLLDHFDQDDAATARP